jgi:molecular chaperone DnaJ
MSFLENSNHYQTLNVNRDEQLHVIKQEYTKLAKIYHPDINSGHEESFIKIQEAW